MNDQMTVEQAAALLQLPTDRDELLARLDADPRLPDALLAVRDGAVPEAVAARLDLPWVDGQEPTL